MATWIALLRGIGGGFRPLPMPELRKALQSIGLQNVRTYIQSGNVVFECPRTSAAALTRKIETCVTRGFGFEATAIVLSARELAAIAAGNPFPQAVAEPATLSLFFLSRAATAANVGKMRELQMKVESFVLTSKVFYLHTPQSFKASKLGPRVEKLLGVPATARNWRTVTKLIELASLPHSQ